MSESDAQARSRRRRLRSGMSLLELTATLGVLGLFAYVLVNLSG